MDVKSRNRVVNKYNYCVNCLAKSHDLRACASVDTCRKCGSYHHTLLHPGIKSRLIRNAPQSTSTTLKTSVKRPTRRNQKTSKGQKPSKPRPTKKSTAPDERIISEAIRSLANVLCGQK